VREFSLEHAKWAFSRPMHPIWQAPVLLNVLRNYVLLQFRALPVLSAPCPFPHL
jgi:hypothetical protein